METDVLLTPPPDSVDGVFADRYFLQHLQYEIKQIKTHSGVVLSKGQKWKRTPYDTLFEKDMMTIPRIIEGYIEIRKKKSKLSAGCRNIIQHMVEDATHYMYNTYRKINCMT